MTNSTILDLPLATSGATLAPEALAALGRLAAPLDRFDFYLAGSAALALRLGHRAVRDLDLMSVSARLAPAERRDLLAALIELEPTVRVETARDGYLFVRWPGEVALRFHWYPYPLVAPTAPIRDVEVASLVDLALMKLGALVSRGTKRDFVDLYLLDRALPLEAAFERAGEKFGHVGDFELQARKALADLTDAEGDPMPPMPSNSEPLDWEAVAAWARSAAARGAEGLFAAEPSR